MGNYSLQVTSKKNTPRRSCRPNESERRHLAVLHKARSSVPQKTAFGTYKALTSQKPQAKAPDRRYQRRKRIPRRKPANSPRIRRMPNSGAFCLCREKRSVFGKTWLQRRQKHASPFCLTTLQKVEFALLFQKPIQDPSTRLRLGRDDSLWPPKLCVTFSHTRP